MKKSKRSFMKSQLFLQWALLIQTFKFQIFRNKNELLSLLESKTQSLWESAEDLLQANPSSQNGSRTNSKK